MPAPSPLLTALAAAAEAGRLLSAAFGALGQRHHALTKRSAVDLLTEYDERSEALIVERIAADFPGDLIIAEEGGARGGAGPANARWLVDPIDGTTNFAHGIPFFCVAIAREVADVVEVGVVHAPALGLTFAATRGGGATCNGAPIHVSDATELPHGLFATGFPYDRQTSVDNNFDQFLAFQRRAQGVRRLGAAALDLAFVARGAFEGFWEMKLKPWDIAAGALLVEEAGGRVSGWQGEPPSPTVLERGAVVASNGALHAPMLALLSATGIPAAAR